jgi:hypothetical protein
MGITGREARTLKTGTPSRSKGRLQNSQVKTRTNEPQLMKMRMPTIRTVRDLRRDDPTMKANGRTKSLQGSMLGQATTGILEGREGVNKTIRQAMSKGEGDQEHSAPLKDPSINSLLNLTATARGNAGLTVRTEPNLAARLEAKVEARTDSAMLGVHGDPAELRDAGPMTGRQATMTKKTPNRPRALVAPSALCFGAQRARKLGNLARIRIDGRGAANEFPIDTKKVSHTGPPRPGSDGDRVPSDGLSSAC